MIRRLFGRAGAAAGLAAVFAAASAAGLIVHIDSAPARGVAARAVNGALRAGVRGEVVVRRVERLGLDGFEIAAVEARAPGGERALLATGLRARIDVPALARGLLGDGEIGAAVSRIEIDHADVDVGLGASGAPRIAEAFSPSRGGGAGRPVRIAIDRIELGEGWIHGAPAEGREVDATVAGVIGRAVIGPALTRIEIEDARVEERRLLDGAGLGAGEAAAIEARVAGHVEIGGGAEGREIAGTMSIEGSAAGIGIAGRVDLDGARARGVLGLEAPGAAIDVAFEAEPGEGRAWASARAPSLVAAPWLPAGMGGSAAARADVAWRGDDVDGRIEARAVGLRVGEALSAPQARLRAEVRGRLSGAAPRIDVSLRAEDVVAGGRALDRVAVDAAGSSRALQARAEISRAALRIEGRAEIDAMGAEARGIRIEIDRGRDHAEGRVARASMRGGGFAIEELVIEGRGLGKIEGALSLRGDEIDADLHGERLDVGRLAAIAGVPGVGGLARVDLELRGPRGARAGRLEIDLA
ncbi:MAG: hypothetical protein IT372_02330, partial [Polyangiaceae bacterium]|nr:hypothetical protein [Polyangiaceae bacterium]